MTYACMDTLRFGATIIDTVVKKGKKSTGGWASRMLIEQIIIVCVLYSTKRYNIYNQVYTILINARGYTTI